MVNSARHFIFAFQRVNNNIKRNLKKKNNMKHYHPKQSTLPATPHTPILEILKSLYLITFKWQTISSCISFKKIDGNTVLEVF